MGEAKRRGTEAQRISEGIEKRKAAEAAKIERRRLEYKQLTPLQKQKRLQTIVLLGVLGTV